MTQQQVIEWAKRAGLAVVPNSCPVAVQGLFIELERFATLVRNAALDEAKQKVLSFQAGWIPDGFTECAAALESLKEPTP